MKRIIFFLSTLFCLCLCAAAKSPSCYGDTIRREQSLSMGTELPFTFSLLEEIEKQNEDNGKSFVVSPLSLWIALGMLQNGAAGNTLAEMQQTMGMKDYSSEQLNQYNQQLMKRLRERTVPDWAKQSEEGYADRIPLLESANSIWSDTGFPFLSSFYEVNTKYYDAELQTLDLSEQASMDTIDEWVKEATHDAIPSIKMLPDDYLRMILINTLYFKGSWMNPFMEENTKYDTFYNLGTDAVSIPMMHQVEEFEYVKAEGYQAVKLRYGLSYYADRFSMTLFLPELNDGQKPLSAEIWRTIQKTMQTQNVDLYLPRFRFSNEINLNDILASMGISGAFSPYLADFSNMSPRPLFVSIIKQLAHIDVNENGTVAAAATVIAMKDYSVPEEPIKVCFNRPFYFTIEDNETGSVLFMGRVLNIVEGSGEAGSITSQSVDSSESQHSFYDLTGRQLYSKPQRGFYLKDGKKYWVKRER